MKDKKTLTYIIIIAVLVIILGVMWYIIISDNNTNNSNNTLSGMNNNSQTTYSGVKEITSNEDITSGEYKSSNADENAILVTGNIKSTLSNITVNKTGDSAGGDNTSFYGTNSAILAKSGANLTIKNATITTDATGANGVFSYGGSATTNNSSNTAGTSSAAIRSDRGGGTVTVNKGTYKTTGKGSPTIYSTADITVKNAKLIATASEGVVIEGKNSVTLENVKLTDTNNTLNGQSTTYKNIFIYQSMSGDADTGTAEFSSKDSTIVTNKGDSIYVTNTKANITLENNKFTNKDTTGNFLRIQKDSWGNSGSNGGDVSLKLINQKVSGNIVVDSISILNMELTQSSSYEGTINSNNEAKEIKLILDSNSKIKLTGDSYISELEDADSTYSNIDLNGYKLYVGGKELSK